MISATAVQRRRAWVLRSLPVSGRRAFGVQDDMRQASRLQNRICVLQSRRACVPGLQRSMHVLFRSVYLHEAASRWIILFIGLFEKYKQKVNNFFLFSDHYSIPQGIFLFLGYSEADETLLKPHNNLSVIDAASTLQQIMSQSHNKVTYSGDKRDRRSIFSAMDCKYLRYLFSDILYLRNIQRNKRKPDYDSSSDQTAQHDEGFGSDSSRKSKFIKNM